LRHSCPASVMTVRMSGNNGPSPPNSREPARRSDMLAGSTLHAIGRPNVSTRMWRLRPFTRLYPSKPRTPPRFCCLYRLPIHDYHRRTCRPARFPASLFIDCPLHASPHALARLAKLILMEGANWPLPAIKSSIADAVQYVVQVARRRDGSRGISELLRVDGYDGEHAKLWVA
jgi:hypothetical protein